VAKLPGAALEVGAMIKDPLAESYSFRARVCLGIAAIGFLIFVGGVLMNVLQ